MRKVIDVEENIFNGVSSQCNNTASSVEGSKGKLGPCFSGKLLNYYNSSCNNKIDSQITSIATELQNLSLSIKASLQAYQETDENLEAALDFLIDDIFESEYETIDAPYEVNNETTPMCLDERKQYLDNLIKSYKEVLDSLKSEFTSKYKDDCVNDIDPKTYAVLNTLMTCFIKGGSFEGDGGSYNSKTNSGSYTITQLKRFTDFVKENSLPKKMDSYFSGKSWDKSGMDDFNRLIISNLTEPGYISLMENFKKAEIDDCVEASFLGQFYYNLKKLGLGEDVNCVTLGGNISNLLNDGTSNIDKEEIARIKNIMSQYYQNKLPYQTRFDENTVNYGMFDYVNARVDEYNSYTSDMETITATIYNYEQAIKLLPYQSYLKDIEFKEFFENDFQKNIDKYYNKYSKEIGNDSKYLTSEELALYAYLSKEISLSGAQNYLKALTDKINNAKGLEQALNFIIDRDKEGMDLGDIFATMFTGEVDGVSRFFEGIGKLLNPTQPRTALDYKMYYLMAFLSNPKEFGLGDLNLANNESPTLDAINGILDNLTLSDTDKQIIEKTYNIFSSAGNMLVPQLIGIAGIAGSVLSSNPAVAAIARKISMALLGTSAAGHATNDAVLSGHGLLESYLYGGISGASEALFESIGGVLGLGDTNLLNFSGWSFVKEYVKSMGKEGVEEFFQEYFDAGIRALVLGEPFDLGETTRAALAAGLYGMAVAGVMNTSTIAIKIGNKIYNLKYDSLMNIDFSKVSSDEELETIITKLERSEWKPKIDEWVQTKLKKAIGQKFGSELANKLDLSKIIVCDSVEEFVDFMKSRDPHYKYDNAGGAHFHDDGTIIINPYGKGINSVADILGNIIHECIHELGNILQGNIFQDDLTQKKFYKYDPVAIRELNEALTEMFTRYGVSGDEESGTYNYPVAYKGYEALEYLFKYKIPGLEYSDFETAYFNDKSIDAIATRINDIMGDKYNVNGKNFFEQLIAAFKTRDYETIKPLLRKIAVEYQNSGGSQ